MHQKNQGTALFETKGFARHETTEREERHPFDPA
jgi:hypothetical protein